MRNVKGFHTFVSGCTAVASCLEEHLAADFELCAILRRLLDNGLIRAGPDIGQIKAEYALHLSDAAQ